MKLIRAAIIATMLLASAGCATQKAVDPRKLSFEQLNFNIPKSERLTLSNGIRVYLLEDHELPLVNITAIFKGGAIYDPPQMPGLSGLTGAAIRSGGTRELSPEKLDAELEFMSSSIESSISEENGTLSMASLVKNLDKTMQLYADVMTKPGFDQSRIDLAIKGSVDAIRRQNDDPKGIASREYRRAIFAGHQLGQMPTVEGIRKISRLDIIACYNRSVIPGSMILAVSGDFNSKEMVARLEKLFGEWRPFAMPLPEVEVPQIAASGEVLIARKPVNQSVVRMGHLGLEKSNPDQYAVRVMDYILGGGFTSRLTQQIRSDRGLAYHAGSHFEIGRGLPGVFTAETETKSESTVQAIKLINEIIGVMRKEPVSEQELSLAKESIINSFIFGFTRADSVVSQQARLEYFAYKPGYLENFRDNIAKVTKEDILRVAGTYLQPEKMTIMVVGDEAKFDKPLATVGKVREIKLETYKPGGDK